MRLTGRLADEARRFAFQGSFATRACSHAGTAALPSARPVCPACVAAGSSWVHLRMCLTCGAVGCCDSSMWRHARRHHDETGHPLIRSIEPGESWAWCYVDRAYLGNGRGGEGRT